MSTGHGISQQSNASGGLGFSASQLSAQTTDTTSLRGQTVVITKDPSSLLLDAQEEMAAMRAGDKSLEKRSPKRSLSATAIGIDIAKQYISRGELSDVLEGGVTQELASRLKNMHRRNASISDSNDGIKDILDRVDDGMIHKRFAILVGLQNTINADFNNSEKALLQVELENLYAEQGMAIRAGFNTVDVAKKHSKLDDERSLMSLYLTTVIDAPSLSDIYQDAVEKYGRNRFSDVMQFLLSASGKDMDSIASSKDSSALGSIVTNLRKLQVLRTIESACHSAIDILQHALKPGITGIDLFSSVLKLIEIKWPLPDTVCTEYLKLSKHKPQAIVWIHNALYNVIESVPLTVFKDDATRMVLMTALADARSMVTEDEEFEIMEFEAGEESGRGNP